MDIKQAEMQFLGFFGAFQEAFKLISSHRKIFTQIAFAFLLLPSLFFMTYQTVSDSLNDSISTDQFHLDIKWHEEYDLARSISIKKAILKAHNFVSLFLLLVSYPLATLAITCSVACIYAGGETIFKKLIRVVPKIYKRLAITSLYAYLVIFFSFKINSIVYQTDIRPPFGEYLETFLVHALKALVFLGLGYMIISSQMALVVSVLEKASGVEAIVKGMRLAQGKKWTVLLRLAALYVPIRIVYAVFDDKIRDRYERLNIVVKILYGAALVLFFLGLVVFALVVQAVTYYVCKSDNGERVDVLTLLDDLEVYREEPALEEKAPLKGDDETMQEQAVDHV